MTKNIDSSNSHPGPDVTGAWLEINDPGERKFQKIGFLLLENGETLPDVTIAYQSWGTLNDRAR
jgi:homoserine O-acetyltransferase/O-succinyltransferase